MEKNRFKSDCNIYNKFLYNYTNVETELSQFPGITRQGFIKSKKGT